MKMIRYTLNIYVDCRYDVAFDLEDLYISDFLVYLESENTCMFGN